MIIKKFLHSCILLEKNGKKLLFDPGAFSFIEGKVKVEDIGSVDAILITHSHLDHFDPAILKELLKLGNPKIYTISEIAELLTKEGIESVIVEPGTCLDIVGFDVQIISAKHEPLPIPCPFNVGYLIDGKILNPGDSYHPEGIDSCETLLLPIAGPWATLVDALGLVDKAKPKKVIPIHDAIIKDFMLERMYGMLKKVLNEKGIEFDTLIQ